MVRPWSWRNIRSQSSAAQIRSRVPSIEVSRRIRSRAICASVAPGRMGFQRIVPSPVRTGRTGSAAVWLTRSIPAWGSASPLISAVSRARASSRSCWNLASRARPGLRRDGVSPESAAWECSHSLSACSSANRSRTPEVPVTLVFTSESAAEVFSPWAGCGFIRSPSRRSTIADRSLHRDEPGNGNQNSLPLAVRCAGRDRRFSASIRKDCNDSDNRAAGPAGSKTGQVG